MSGPGPGLSASVGHRVLKGGTSIIWHQLSCLSLVQPATRFSGGGCGRWWGRGLVLDTLLGPEGSGLCALSFWAAPA